MLINGKTAIKIYPRDTKDTVLYRIANVMKTTVQWIYIKNFTVLDDISYLNSATNINILVINIFDHIKDNFKNYVYFGDIESDSVIADWSERDSDALDRVALI